MLPSSLARIAVAGAVRLVPRGWATAAPAVPPSGGQQSTSAIAPLARIAAADLGVRVAD